MTAPRRKTVGLALSGGSARGAAHLGVLQVLERGGIQIDVVSGVSAGSVVGALYCAGIPLDEMVRALKGFSWQHIAALTLSYHGLLSFAKLEQYLTRWIGDVWFSELKKPFAVGATDLLTGRPITFTAGRVAPLVRASCSIPGLVVPLEYGEYWLTDGGISCNLPSYAARQLGADLVIGVDLMKPYVRKNLGVAGIASTAVEIMIRHSGGGAGRGGYRDCTRARQQELFAVQSLPGNDGTGSTSRRSQAAGNTGSTWHAPTRGASSLAGWREGQRTIYSGGVNGGGLALLGGALALGFGVKRLYLVRQLFNLLRELLDFIPRRRAPAFQRPLQAELVRRVGRRQLN